MPRMKKLLIFLILFASKASAQITFEKTFAGNDDQSGYSVQQTFDGGYIVAGQNLNFPHRQLLLLLRTDSLGDTLWTRSFGGPSFDLFALSVEQTYDNGFAVCGSYADGNGNTIFLVKTDQNGNLLWTKRYSSVTTEVIGGSMKQTPDSGFVICGKTWASNGTGQVLVIKTNSIGDTLWSKLYLTGSSEGKSIDITNDNGYIITGMTPNGPVILKIDANGNSIFQKHFTFYAYETRIRSTSDGGYLLTGTFNPSTQNDAFLLKTDSTGNVLWTKLFDGPLNNNDWGNTIIETKDSNYVLTIETASYVYFVSQLQLIKVDRTGNVLWSSIFDGVNNSGCFFDACASQTSDEGFIISGHRTSPTTNHAEIYLIKTDSVGNTGCNISNPLVLDSFITTSAIPIAPGSNSFPGIVSSFLLTDSTVEIINTLCSSVGIQTDDFRQDELQIFPNPASRYFTVQMNRIDSRQLELFNSTGEKILSKNIPGKNFIELNCDNLPDGIYFLRVTFANGEIATSKITLMK